MTGERQLFVLGDSVSVHYGPYLRDMTKGVYCYSRKGSSDGIHLDADDPEIANGGDSRMVLQYLTELAGQGAQRDVLLLNCGLHDARRHRRTGLLQVPPDDYRVNLECIFQRAAEAFRCIVWVETTPVKDAVHNSRGTGCLRYEADIVQYNCIANEMAERFAIPIIALHGFTQSLGENIYCDHVHFLPHVRALQAAHLAGVLNQIANTNTYWTKRYGPTES